MGPSKRWAVIGAALAMVAAGMAAVTSISMAEHGKECSQRYVATGDAVAKGKDAESAGNYSETKRYSRQLLDDDGRLHKFGAWCEFNTSDDPATTDDYITKVVFEGLSQQSAVWERDPRLVTVTLGRQNATIVDHVDQCFKNVKDHDFAEANACALKVLSIPAHWEKLKQDLTKILNTFRIQQNGAPSDIVVAVTGYFNPYPAATDVATKIPAFCAQLTDTIPTCIARWVLLPPALVTLDQVVKKLNTTIEEVVKLYTEANQGRPFYFVNPYDKFKSHCMEMKVTIKTKVYHPKSTVHDHNTNETNFGCNDTWIATDGKDGTKSPFPYLTPAVTGVLIHAEQTTKNMGIHPNEKGHDCISDLIWEAAKIRLGVQQQPDPSSACTGS